MAFELVIARTPTSIGNVVVVLKDGGGPNKSAHYQVEILDQDGRRIPVGSDTGDLVPHLSQSDIDWLIDFINRMRAKAVAEFIG